MRQVLIIHNDGNTLSNPTLRALITSLTERGDKVFVRYPLKWGIQKGLPGVEFIHHGRIFHLLFEFSARFPMFRLIIELLAIWEIGVTFRGVKFSRLVGVDRLGGILGGAIARRFCIPLTYVSFEIQFESETSKRFKRAERYFAPQIENWIVQDEVRRELVAAENQLSIENSFLLPLASKGARTTGDRKLRDLIGIPEHMKVAAVFGSQAPWTMIEEIILAVGDWPDGWALMIHDRTGSSDIVETYLRGLAKEVRSKIFVSNTVFPDIDDLSVLLSGVDVGLAFYKPIPRNIYLGKNIQHIGFASGKIATCFRYGIPVICNSIGQYSKAIIDHDIGRVVEHPCSIKNHLEEVNWRSLSESAHQFFDDHLDYAVFESRLLAQVFDD